MSWPASLLVGLITALVAAVAGGFAATAGMEWHQVSSREGQQGFALAFIFIPLALLVGLGIGIMVARADPPVTFAAGLGRLARAVGVALVLVVAALGAAWVTADHAPTIDGRTLELHYEVRLPPGFPLPDSLDDDHFRVGLVVSSLDRAFTTVDFERVTRADSFVIVPGHGSLNSTGTRSITVSTGTFGETLPSQFAPIPLAPRPGKSDFEWSEWVVLTRRMDLSDVPPGERAQVRYRIQFADSAGA